jgi:hypothetical protein
MEKITNERNWRKMEIKRDIVLETEEQRRWYSHVTRIQDDKFVKQWNGTHLGKEKAADQISHGTKELQRIWRKEI